MLCEKCKKNNATTFFRQVINGKETRLHLCEKCADELTGEFEKDYTDIFSNFGLGIDSMLGSILGQDFIGGNLLEDKSERCPMCNTSIEEIRRTGNVGCSKCYETFKAQLLPLVKRIHGNTAHNGKVPSSAESKITLKSKIDELQKELNEKIASQEFEKAAEIRDKIAELKKSL